MSKLPKIKNIFKEYDILIENEIENEEFCKIKIKNCFIFFEKKTKNMYFSFNAKTRPDYSAFVVSIIHQLDHIQNVFIGDLYYNDPNGTIFGNKAYVKFFTDVQDIAVSEYWKQIQEIGLLRTFEPDAVN